MTAPSAPPAATAPAATEPAATEPADCPAAGRVTRRAGHGSFTAIKRHKCTCDGPGRATFTAYRDRQNARSAAHDPGRVTAPDFPSPDVPQPTFPASSNDHRLDHDPRLACRDHDPELWFPIGAGTLAHQQTQQAKTICRSCPRVRDCLAGALRRGEDSGIWGATTPDERRAMRAHKAVA